MRAGFAIDFDAAQHAREFLAPAFRIQHVGRGLAVADFDNDGDLDVVVSDSGGKPLLLRNGTAEPADITVQPDLPAGWNAVNPPGTYHVEPGGTWPIQLFFTAPEATGLKSPQTLRWTARKNGTPVGAAELSVYLEYDGVPQ